MRRLSILSAILGVLILGATPARAAWDYDPTANVPLCTVSGEQYYVAAVSDGAGGAIVAWSDFRAGAGDIYARRISANGTAMWGTNGTPVCALTFTQWMSVIVDDGAGGAYIAWSDGRNGGANDDIYVQRMNAGGSPMWTANGVLACGAANVQGAPVMVRDGEGGVIVAWVDRRSGTDDVWAQRVAPDGSMRWTGDGVRLTGAAGSQARLKATADGNGGAIVAWTTEGPNFGDPPMTLTAQKVDSTGVIQWGLNGTPVGSFSALNERDLCSDGAGGVIVGWVVAFSFAPTPPNPGDILVQRLNAAGAPLWGGGTPLTVYTPGGGMALATDGAGGAFIGWSFGSPGSQDISAQHVDGAGVFAWPAAGKPVSAATGGQGIERLMADGEGGVVVSWADSRSGNSDIYAQRLDAAGAAQWTGNGVAVGTATTSQHSSSLVPSTNGDWILVWEDHRNEAWRDIYAQNVDRYGYLGIAAPTISSITDQPADQGGVVRLQWFRSYLDRTVNPGVVEYRVFRQTGSAPAKASLPTTDVGWQLEATVPATQQAPYSVAVPSDGDDVGGAHPLTTYRVEAHSSTLGTGPHWSSASITGWSVDNIAPPAPTSLFGTYDSGVTSLDWDPSPASDFGTFRIYRHTDYNFTPAPENLLAETTNSEYQDAAAGQYVYRVTTVDTHLNASGSAAWASGGVAVEPGAEPALALGAPWPHPVRESGVLRFTIPRAGAARLTLFDTAGRWVATLHDGATSAGTHTVPLDGTALASGLYLLRLESGGLSATRRLVISR